MSLGKDTFNNYKKARKQASVYSGQITEKVNTILREVVPSAVPGVSLSWWDWKGGGEYNDGHIDNSICNDSLSIDLEWDYGGLNLDRDVRYYLSSFEKIPFDLLVRTNEEIIAEIQEDISAMIESKKEKARKAKEAREKKKAAKQAVLNKLTKEEKKALGIK